MEAEKQAVTRNIEDYEAQIKFVRLLCVFLTVLRNAERALEGLKAEKQEVLKQQKAVEDDRAAQVPRVK